MQRQPVGVQTDPTLMRLVTSAVVSTERLTGCQEWDQYLQRLQPWLNDAMAATQEWLVRLSGAMTDQDVRIAQMNYHACQARVATLQEVMQLPNEILKARSQADHNTPAVESTITDARGTI